MREWEGGLRAGYLTYLTHLRRAWWSRPAVLLLLLGRLSSEMYSPHAPVVMGGTVPAVVYSVWCRYALCALWVEAGMVLLAMCGSSRYGVSINVFIIWSSNFFFATRVPGHVQPVGQPCGSWMHYATRDVKDMGQQMGYNGTGQKKP